MKKNLPIIILVGVIILAGLAVGGWYLFLRGGQVPGVPSEGGQGILTPQGEGQGFTGKLKDALTLGQSMKCTWSQDADNFGTAYIKNEQVYSEVTANGKKAFMITADNCTYTWEEGATEGYQMCFEPTETEEMVVTPGVGVGEEEVPAEYQGETPEVNYDCRPAVVSDSMFNPPAGVKFINPQEMMGR
jgi:hypothetical protein